MKIIELFSGIGGFIKGFEEAGYTFEEHYFSEIDKHAIANYKYNFPNAKHIGDVKSIQPRDFAGIDLITGGFPCQPFSTAGKRQGFEDTRGTLFFEIVRICKEIQPKYLLLENVRGLLNHDGGRTFSIVYQTLIDIGYTIEFQLVNTKWFLPQNRERIYIVGHLATTKRSFQPIFPIGENDQLSDRETRQKSGESENKQTTYSRTITSRIHKMGSDDPYVRTNGKLRRLTEIECERLQGFSDNFTQFGNYDGQIKEISATQRYKMIGNAVSVPVVKEIAKRLKNQK